MDLLSGYLLIIILLFSIEISLYLGNFKLNKGKVLLSSIALGVLIFICIYPAKLFQNNFSFLLTNYSYVFILLSIALLAIYLYYFKNPEKLKLSLIMLIILFAVSSFLLATEASELTLILSLLYSLCVIICVFLVYLITNLLHHAKREYPVIIGEFSSLSTILILIFGITYYATYTLDYTQFSAYLILTPTYQLIYVIIGMMIILIAGLLYNDNGGNI